jgi:hypothetical protein
MIRSGQARVEPEKQDRHVLAAIVRRAIERYEEVRAAEVNDGQADTKPASREGGET